MPPSEEQEQREETVNFRRELKDDIRDVKTDIHEVREDVRCVRRVLDGNGGDAPGITMKVDRLERDMQMIMRVCKWIIATIVVAMTGMLIKAVTRT